MTIEAKPKINVLVSLHKGYGLGDSVQMSAVLRHVVRARPNWIIDFQAEKGYHLIGRGIVDNVFYYGQRNPSPHYEAEVQIVLYDTFAAWGDRPNTRVSSCLLERFGLPWEPSLGRYRVATDADGVDAARALLYGTVQISSKGATRQRKSVDRIVAVHYQGDSAQEHKNLTEGQAGAICAAIEQVGCTPVVLDWRGRSRLPFYRISSPAHWGGDAEMVTTVISQCAGFIGIDSGPSKCASATDTPALIVWTGHHPALFHDPAPNTTHLVPVGYHGMRPVLNNPDVVRWFEDNYSVMEYEVDPVREVRQWLREVFR